MQGTVVHALPLADRVTRDPGLAQMAWLLPGSSIKGALRSHAERIVRTLRGVAAPGDFLEAVRDRQLGPVLTLFGFADAWSAGQPVSIGRRDGGARSTCPTAIPARSSAAMPGSG